jgi:import receptor subunit TOM20
MDKRATILTISGVTIAGLLAYAVYFDYKRRNDVEFRKQLRKSGYALLNDRTLTYPSN